MRVLFVRCLGVLAALSCALSVSAQTAGVTDPNAIRVLLSPQLETTLMSQVAGRIAVLDASLGAFVAQGSTIVELDCAEARAREQMAQAEQVSAREILRAKTALRKLKAAGESEVAQAVAASNRAKAGVELAHAQVGQCTVSAPFSGRIVKIHAKPFQGVNAGAPLVEMVSDGALKLRLNVPSTYLRTLTVGAPFEVDITDIGKRYTARVTAINARIDAASQTVELEAMIDGEHEELLAGMTGIAHLTQGS